MTLITNYFSVLSGWIANLGVVPWLRLRAFLLAPAFFNLLFFLIFVILVLETIKYLLVPPYSQQSYSRTTFLTSKSIVVKGLLLLLPCCIIQNSSSASIILHPKELTTLHIPNTQQFTISNKKIIKTKYLPSKELLLIRAKSAGVSNILILSKHPKKIKIQVISSFHNNSNTKYSESQKQQLLSQISYYLLNGNIEDFYCTFPQNVVICYLGNKVSIPQTLHSFLKKSFPLKFINRAKAIKQNVHFIFKLLLIESNSDHYIKLGINNLYTDLRQLFLHPSLQLTQKQQQILSNNHLKISSLAQEHFYALEDLTTELSFGAKTSYQEVVIINDKTYQKKRWLFTGIKTKVRFYQYHSSFILHYSNNFSRPIGPQNLSTNHQTGNIIFHPNQAIKLFEINYLAKSDQIEAFPLLSRLPLLNILFTAHQSQQIQKKIIGVLYATIP